MPIQFTIIYKRGCDELEEVENQHIAGLRYTQLHKFRCYNGFHVLIIDSTTSNDRHIMQ